MKKACFILLAAAALAAGVLAWNAMDKAAGKEATAQTKRDEDFAKWRKAVDAAHENWRDRNVFTEAGK